MTVASPADPRVGTLSLRRSPLAHRAAELAAHGVDGPRGVRLAEEPFLTQVNLRVHPGSPAVARIEHALDLALPHHEPNLVSGDENGAALWLGPDEWLLVAPDGKAAELVTATRDALSDSLGSTVDVSANRTTLRLSGPMAREVLEKVCSLDLHPRSFTPGRCAQTLVGRTQAVLWQLDPKPCYRLLVRNSFANYLTDLLLDAMQEFTTR
ncbi:sarcosine oxidase subunit gamma [Saccharopolyspora phatthalungensis]|uniref:Sarcosine oxidase subunit gamma n=1 Tax=Saccharopolyspora phatthalungensis TaxID=664693 RepID=A0A840QBP7_9PSEU|nr:sarcosine oxidase subunit gamma family protein [Saccharopolyspora phatthalungensis]MBB5155865.1 sarcosine oxidase subunit gamma [Saccharopolyspora phatthalungensis]